MADIPEEILAEREQVEKALAILLEVLQKREKSIVELSAIATFLHNCYNGIENILKQTTRKKKISIPFSEHWHKKLLQVSVKENIISNSLTDKLYDFLAFRHFFIHGYGHRLNEEQLLTLAVKWRMFGNNFSGK